MNFKALALTAVTALTLAAPSAHAGMAQEMANQNAAEAQEEARCQFILKNATHAHPSGDGRVGILGVGRYGMEWNGAHNFMGNCVLFDPRVIGMTNYAAPADEYTEYAVENGKVVFYRKYGRNGNVSRFVIGEKI